MHDVLHMYIFNCTRIKFLNKLKTKFYLNKVKVKKKKNRAFCLKKKKGNSLVYWVYVSLIMAC